MFPIRVHGWTKLSSWFFIVAVLAIAANFSTLLHPRGPQRIDLEIDQEYTFTSFNLVEYTNFDTENGRRSYAVSILVPRSTDLTNEPVFVEARLELPAAKDSEGNLKYIRVNKNLPVNTLRIVEDEANGIRYRMVEWNPRTVLRAESVPKLVREEAIVVANFSD